MRLLFTGGGTGGHLYPALAVADRLRELKPDCEILFAGTGEGLEGKVVPKTGYPFHHIVAGKWPRSISFGAIGDLTSLARGYLQSVGLLKRLRPQAVFATGGYVSVPVGLAAVRLKIPLYLHEQNSVPGMANKLLSRWAKATFTTFLPEQDSFPSGAKMIHAGLPIRKGILKTNSSDAFRYFGFNRGKDTLLVTGGSRGARRINQVMLDIYHKISLGKAMLPQLQIIHLTGTAEYGSFCQAMDHVGINTGKIGKIVVKPYLDKMEYALSIADLVIGRAGAATLAEITALGIPAILIPYPFAAADHQYYNALDLERNGAAVVIVEQDLTSIELLKEIEKIINDRDLHSRMSILSKELGRPEAVDLIADILCNSCNK